MSIDQANLAQESWQTLSEPMLESIFSPLQVQIKAETWSPSADGMVGKNTNFDHLDVQFQHDSTEADAFISEFLDSVLNSSGDIEFENQQVLAINLENDMQEQDRKQVNLSSF